MYDVNSKHADDFINHQEILETLAYADANKNNRELIEALIDKAALRKGLSHREASVLLVCEEEDLNQKIYKLAEQIKKDFYGNRIVLFAPLYRSCLLYTSPNSCRKRRRQNIWPVRSSVLERTASESPHIQQT